MTDDDLDNALHGISQMALIALGLTQEMRLNEEDYFQLEKADGERLAFAVADILDRVEKLQADLLEGPRPGRVARQNTSRRLSFLSQF
jgi:hypothetical protein